MGTAKGFETGPDGNIITHPLMGYVVVPVADTAILARLEYSDHPDQLRAMQGKHVQLILTPPQALEIADVLTRAANRILDQNAPHEKN